MFRHVCGISSITELEKPMTGQPVLTRLLPAWGAVMLLLAGCHLPSSESKQQSDSPGPIDRNARYAVGPLSLPDSSGSPTLSQKGQLPVPTATVLPLPQVVEVARATSPESGLAVEVESSAKKQAAALTAGMPPPDEVQWQAASATGGISPLKTDLSLSGLHKPLYIREEHDVLPRVVIEQAEALPRIPLAPDRAQSVTTAAEPPIRPRAAVIPGVPIPANTSVAADPPAVLPPLPAASLANAPSLSVPAGPISMGGQSITFDALAKMVDGQLDGGPAAGCASCGDCGPGRPCTPGSHKCEPFPDDNPLLCALGMIYNTVCCPDPCYQPHWEPIADSAFFVDPARPISNTRLVWDAVNHFAYPDRAEFFWAAQPRGPAATDGLKAVPYINYNQLTLVTEIATGNASVAIAMPYRSWDAEPFAHSAAGFSDMSITAKTLLVDSELFLCSMQMRTYIPIGDVTKGLGDGHVSLEPGVIFGLRLTPTTFAQAEVQEWIPIGGDPNSQGAFLQWGLSINQLLWQPVKDVQFIGTLELTGNSYQAGQFTDPVLGPQKLSGENNVMLGNGYRLFFCNFDVGIAGNYAITGKYVAREAMQFDLRFRY